MTAIDYCAYYGHTSCLELLLASGADPSLNEGKCLFYAVFRDHESTSRLLIDRCMGLKEQVFYDHIIAGASSISALSAMNRRAILIALYNGYPELYLSLLRVVSKAVVDAEQPSWQGIERRRA